MRILTLAILILVLSGVVSASSQERITVSVFVNNSHSVINNTNSPLTGFSIKNEDTTNNSTVKKSNVLYQSLVKIGSILYKIKKFIF